MRILLIGLFMLGSFSSFAQNSNQEMPKSLKCYFEIGRTASLTKELGVQLCAGATDHVAPQKCYFAAKRTTSLEDAQAVELCAGTNNEVATIKCFFETIRTSNLDNTYSLAAKLCATKH